jgi:peptidoglycan/xylan/chitin deacetylase (PgdA/CDA1 family)
VCKYVPMSLYFKIKRVIACLLVNEKKTLQLKEPLISFSFDDAPNSAFVAGRRILNKYGYKGTYYISLGIRQQNDPRQGYFDTAHLKEVVADGGELACHTYSHIHFYTSSGDLVRKDLEENQRKLNEFIPGYRFSNFSYPYGEQTISGKILVRSIFRSARSVKAGINFNPVDLNNLRALQLEKGLSLEKAFAYIEQTIAQKGWLIFYSHDIQEDCSRWGCTPSYFEEIVKYCSLRKLNVRTIEKGLDLLQARK